MSSVGFKKSSLYSDQDKYTSKYKLGFISALLSRSTFISSAFLCASFCLSSVATGKVVGNHDYKAAVSQTHRVLEPYVLPPSVKIAEIVYSDAASKKSPTKQNLVQFFETKYAKAATGGKPSVLLPWSECKFSFKGSVGYGLVLESDIYRPHVLTMQKSILGDVSYAWIPASQAVKDGLCHRMPLVAYALKTESTIGSVLISNTHHVSIIGAGQYLGRISQNSSGLVWQAVSNVADHEEEAVEFDICGYAADKTGKRFIIDNMIHVKHYDYMKDSEFITDLIAIDSNENKLCAKSVNYVK